MLRPQLLEHLSLVGKVTAGVIFLFKVSASRFRRHPQLFSRPSNLIYEFIYDRTDRNPCHFIETIRLKKRGEPNPYLVWRLQTPTEKERELSE